MTSAEETAPTSPLIGVTWSADLVTAADVYADAALALKPDDLDLAYAGPALQIVLDDIAKWKAAGTPAQFEVEHDYEVRLLTEDVAEVTDRYVNHSVLLDGKTGEPIEEDPNETIEEIYTLQLLDGTWKVVDISQP